MQRAIDGVVALLRGEPCELERVTLDMDGVPPFHRRVYEVARTIPPGTTLSYGEVAARMGEPGAARDVGQALGQNPFAIIVPCHRVLAANGKVGGFSAPRRGQDQAPADLERAGGGTRRVAALRGRHGGPAPVALGSPC